MPLRKHDFAEGEYYHVFNRGIDKRIIFKDYKDKKRFQNLLFLCNGTHTIHLSDIKGKDDSIYKLDRGEPLVAIGGYCLMGNHFHLLLRECSLGGITKFMQKLCTAYTMYFNLKNERTGSLFQGRFKSRHLDSDKYLKYIYSYIHLNPVEHIDPTWRDHGTKDTRRVYKYLDGYNFSSLEEYLGKNRPESIILDQSQFPAYFKQKGDYLKELNSWLNPKEAMSRPGLDMAEL